jgi:hypothetical protein
MIVRFQHKKSVSSGKIGNNEPDAWGFDVGLPKG